LNGNNHRPSGRDQSPAYSELVAVAPATAANNPAALRKKHVSEATLFDDEAESRLIGACLANNTIVQHCGELHPEDFAGTLYREAWRVFLDWERDRTPFDEEMLVRHLRARNLTVDIAVVLEWMTNAEPVTIARCQRRAEAISRLSRRRQLARNLERAQNEIYDPKISETAIAKHILADARAILEDATAAEPDQKEADAPPVAPEETAALLRDVRHFICRFVMVSEVQAVALSLFVIYTYAAEQFDCAPYLQVTSAEKRSGKTRLLELLALVVARPWLTARTSPAALVRKLNNDRPTLLLDESDAAFGGDKEYSEALRGVLNAGHRQGGKASLCVGKGSDIKVADFDVFGPKVISGIGKLPDTVADRVVPIKLVRKRPNESVERFRPRLVGKDAKSLRERLAQWANQDRLKTLRSAWPELPEALTDRQQDVSEPLLAVADLSGSEWGAAARAALRELFGSAGADDSTGARLLTDIRTAFDTAIVERLSSKDLVAALVAMESSPWPEFNRGKEITANTLARLLRKFDIAPRTIRMEENTFKGYLRESFVDAWIRYLGPNSSTPAVPDVTPSQSAKALNEAQFSKASHTPSVTVRESTPESLLNGVVTAVTVAASAPAAHAPRGNPLLRQRTKGPKPDNCGHSGFPRGNQ
jgi:hypothetical protein